MGEHALGKSAQMRDAAELLHQRVQVLGVVALLANPRGVPDLLQALERVSGAER